MQKRQYSKIVKTWSKKHVSYLPIAFTLPAIGTSVTIDISDQGRLAQVDKLQAGRQTNKQKDGQTCRYADRYTGEQADS
jgi:hypothetical protein